MTELLKRKSEFPPLETEEAVRGDLLFLRSLVVFLVVVPQPPSHVTGCSQLPKSSFL